MKKNKSHILNIILFVTILVSIYLIYHFLDLRELQSIDPIVIIPCVTFIASLSWFVARILNIQHAKRELTQQQRLSMWNAISYRVKKAGETAFNELPIGIIIIDDDFQVVWSNQKAKDIFMSPLEKLNIKNLSSNLYNNLITKIEENKKLQNQETMITFKDDIYGQIYRVEYLIEYRVFYLTNITEHEELIDNYQRKTTAIGYLNIDNLEEALSDFDVHERAEYQGKIMACIGKWADEYGFFIRAYNDTRYMMVMNYEQLVKVMDSNFTILDDVKVLLRTTKLIRITLSIGISCIDTDMKSLNADAQTQLELALTRGGDQAVVKINKKVRFFGAKTDPIIKTSKVEKRNKSQELQDLMRNSSIVFAIGHKGLDADGFAATLAIYRLATSLGKEAYIILDDKSIDATVKRIYDTIKLEHQSLLNAFVHPDKVEKYIDHDSLLMIVDCQSDDQLSDSYFIKKFSKIGIIDHHRQGKGAIKNPKFYYCQPSASSSVELIVELFEFCDEPIDFTEIEATWLLLGMVVDTNNFVYRTSAITFEVASMLDRYGADMGHVKKYLREDVQDKIKKYKFLQNMERINNIVALAVPEDKTITFDRATLAKVSDELISIDGIELGITVGLIGEHEVGISARSLGMINCQLIMEKMGGGGHLNNAAAQFKKARIEDVVKKLRGVIAEYFEKEGTMKIILIKDVKGRGKRGEIIEVQAGYGNYLLTNKFGIVASPENIKALEREKEEEKKEQLKELEEKKELKIRIESIELVLPAKIGAEGKMFGSITSKQIADAIKEKIGVDIDKRKIILENNITVLGTYEIKIQLHKEVTATVKVHVVEK